MRYLDKFLKWLGFGLLLAPFVWYLVFRFDEPLDPEVQAALTAEVSVPEEENGYYTLLGMHAPAEVADVHAHGRDLVAQYRQALAADPDLAAYQFPERALDFRGDQALLCKPQKSACLSQAAKSSRALDRLLEQNAVLLARYRALYRYPRFVETIPAHRSAPFAHYPIDARNLVLARIARDAARGRLEPALDALAADTRYWRAVLADTRTLLTKVVAVASLHRNYELLAEIIAAAPITPAAEKRLQSMLAPLTPAERSMIEPLRWEFAAYGNYAKAIKAGVREGLEGPDNGNATRAVLAWLGDALVQENATRNLVYRHHMAVAALADVPSTEFDARRAALEEEYAFRLGWHYLYNPLGKFLFHVAQPEWPKYAARIHDLDGYIRLVRLQFELKRGRVRLPDVPNYLANAGASLNDPYTAHPMAWDPATKTLSFRGRGVRPKDSPIVAVRLGG